MQLDIGDVVCDMHNVTLRNGELINTGDVNGRVFRITKFIQIRTDNSSQMLDVLTAPMSATNKMAVVVGETYNGKGYQCAYSYDGHKFGLFEMEPV